MPEGLNLTTGGLFSPQGLALASGGLLDITVDENLHPRTRIRKYVVEKLRIAASLTDTGGRVHSERVDPIQARDAEWDLPAVNVFTRDESSEEWAQSPRILKRSVELAIDILAGGRDSEDQIDQLAKEIELLVGSDIHLGQWADDVILQSTATEFDGSGSKKFGFARLIFLATYASEVSVEPQDVLERIHNEWNFTAPDAKAEAEDDIEFEET